MSGALATQTPPWPMAMPEGILRPSMTVVILSNLPSPLVDSSTLTRSLPGPAARFGYSIDSVIQIRPRSSNVIDTGLTISGSAAPSSTRNPGGAFIFLIASCGVSAGPGGLSCACGMTSFFFSGSLLSLAADCRLMKMTNAANIDATMERRDFMNAPGSIRRAEPRKGPVEDDVTIDGTRPLTGLGSQIIMCG